MYEYALPDETRQILAGMEPSGLVVGIPSYRNSRTIGALAEIISAVLAREYAHLAPVVVHIDGYSLDDTLATAVGAALPAPVRRVATRYLGLPGKGSALRALFEVTSTLKPRALLIVEADHSMIGPEWVMAMLAPVLAGELDLVLPRYTAIRPAAGTNDLLLYPLCSTMFGIEARYPAAGDAAMAGGVASYFYERDVWETDVARAGIDIWMTIEVFLEQGRVGQVPLGIKRHESKRASTISEARFLQEVGTFFRMAYLRETEWHEARTPPPPIERWAPVERGEALQLPDISAAALWEQGRHLLKPPVLAQWKEMLPPENITTLSRVLEQANGKPTFDERLWARLVYDSIVVYNQGEGDPDKVITSLFPLFLLRHAALLAAIEGANNADEAREALVQQQRALFYEELPYLHQRWEQYVSPDQLELWRELGILP